jgi:hypothetical protein
MTTADRARARASDLRLRAGRSGVGRRELLLADALLLETMAGQLDACREELVEIDALETHQGSGWPVAEAAERARTLLTQLDVEVAAQSWQPGLLA